jgi:RHS repeat-associated protein
LTTDHLGSPRVVTDERSEVVSRRDFSAFGEEIAAMAETHRTPGDKYGVGDGVRQKFTGYERDEETGLDFAQARYYNPTHGRFTAVDPLLASGKSADPQTFNRYAYAMNRPLILTDPNGLQAGRPVRPQSGTVETVRVQVKAPSAPRIETYPVKGQTSSEVWKSAEESRETGFPGAYNRPFSWSGTFTPTSTRRTRGGYSVTVQTSEIEIEIKDPKITLPEWENKSDASPEEQEKWETSLEKLKKHEFDHHDIAVDCLNNILKPALEAIPAPIVGQGTGKTPEEARNAAIKNETEKIQTEFKKADQKAQDKQNQFDECTDHGRQSCQQ